MGTTKDVADFAIKTTFDNFDPDTIKWAKRILLCDVGMTLAGIETATGKRVLSYVKKCNAPEESGIIGSGFRTSAQLAALAMSATSHSTELEDDAPPELSTDVGYFPAAFALGDKLHVSGKQIIEALVISFEIGSKLTVSSLDDATLRGSMGPYFCTVGVAASAAKMLKLGVKQTTMAVSLAVSHANWFLWFQGGSDAHFYEQGIAMRNGIDSALLAKHGFTGEPNALEVYLGNLRRSGAVAGSTLKLGEPYRIKDIGIKKYPCCYLEMNYIDSFVDLVKTHNLNADKVESIQIDIAPVTAQVLRFHHPKNEMEARFSLTHSIASCFLDKKPWLESYTTKRVNQPEVINFRDKIRMVVHPEWAKPDSLLGAEMPILVKMKNGTEYRKISPKPTDPIIVTDKEVMDKYMKCASRVISKSKAEKIAKIVMSLEEVLDISELMTLLTYPNK